MQIGVILVLLFAVSSVAAQDRVQHVLGTPNNEIRVVNTYPEYWVDGKPFVTHSSAFFYHRLPRDLWAQELEHLKSMGVNAIDIYPLWNWQQPQENALDLDGHTNPRREIQVVRPVGNKAAAGVRPVTGKLQRSEAAARCRVRHVRIHERHPVCNFVIRSQVVVAYTEI